MSKPTATLSPMQHRGDKQIKVEIAFDEKELLKTIKGYKYSRTHQCFYFPHCKESFEQLEKLFEVKIKEGIKPPAHPKPPTPPPSASPLAQKESAFVRLEKENDRRMKAFVPYFKKDWIEKVKSIPGRAWNEKEKYWSLPMTKKSVANIKEWFGEDARWGFEIPKDLPDDYKPKNWTSNKKEARNETLKKTAPPQAAGNKGQNPAPSSFPEPSESRTILNSPLPVKPNFVTIKRDWGEQKMITGEQIIVEQWDPHWLCAYIPGDKKGWLEAIRSFPGRKWKPQGLVWLLPITKETMGELDKFDGQYLIKNFTALEQMPERFPVPPKKTDRAQLNEMQRLAVNALNERLILEFKQPKTIKSYRNILIGLLLFYPATKPSSITKEQIHKYIVYKINERKISSSYMNQMISSFNAFFGRLLGQPEKVMELDRPEKDKIMPNVLPPEEVKKLLESIENLKHKCMLLLLYSSGLRKGELLNLRIKDLEPATETLLVKNGKGRKDRMTLYPPTAIKYVTQYLEMYRPKHWLFEGQKGGRYSESSLQSVFERAKEKSGVNDRITIHGLRHSFATHMTYQGVPLHETQQLLGHESIKSTEIYLHLAQRYRKEIQSPLEFLDL